MLSSSIHFCWDAECEIAFHAAKDLMCNDPILSALDFSRPFKMEVDASAVGAEAVLLQESDKGIDHPVAYFSRKFLRAQRNYSTIR